MTIGQDFGSEIEIVEGLTGDEQVIANPGERIVEGATVVIAEADKAPDPVEKVGECPRKYGQNQKAGVLDAPGCGRPPAGLPVSRWFTLAYCQTNAGDRVIDSSSARWRWV